MRHSGLALWASGFTCDQHATTETDPAKTRPIQPKTAVLDPLCPMGLHCGDHALKSRAAPPPNGELRHARVRHAATRRKRFAWRKPHRHRRRPPQHPTGDRPGTKREQRPSATPTHDGQAPTVSLRRLGSPPTQRQCPEHSADDAEWINRHHGLIASSRAAQQHASSSPEICILCLPTKVLC